MAKVSIATLYEVSLDTNAKIAGLTESVNALVLALTQNAQPAPASKAKAKAVATKTTSSTKKATTPKKGKGKGNAVSEAKKAEHKAATLAYKADKRTRNCLTSKENKLVAKQMREQGLNPADKQAWEKAKKAYIKANPLV